MKRGAGSLRALCAALLVLVVACGASHDPTGYAPRAPPAGALESSAQTEAPTATRTPGSQPGPRQAAAPAAANASGPSRSLAASADPAAPLAATAPRGSATRPKATTGSNGSVQAGAGRLELPLDRARLLLPAGRSLLSAALPPGRFVSLVLTGPAEALLGWALQGPDALGALRAHGPLDDDGKLPAALSFVSPEQPSSVVVVVEVDAAASLWRVSADPDALEAPAARDLKLGRVQPRPLIGLPVPTERRDGYLLQTPQRYLFLRLDIAVALRQALRQTRIRFRRNPIAVGDASQWNGEGPGTDRGKSRHVGHRHGTEIDIGLPSDDDSPSTIQRRCDGVMVEPDELVCAPGTVRHVDAQRLAYFLGLLLDGPTPNGIHMPKGRPGPIAPVLSILTDQAYVDEIRKAAERLRRRRWIHDEGYGALVEEGLLRPSSWHTDHVHIRFAGEPARVLFR